MGARRHVGAEVSGQLDGDQAHAAGRSVDEHPVAGLDDGFLGQRLQRGDTRERQRPRGHRADAQRGPGDHACGREREVGEPSRAAHRHPGDAVDRVPDGEVGHVVADRRDRPGDVGPQRERQVQREELLHPAVPDGQVDRVDAGAVHRDDDLAGRGHRIGNLHDAELLGSSVPLDPCCPHDAPIARPDPSRSQAQPRVNRLRGSHGSPGARVRAMAHIDEGHAAQRAPIIRERNPSGTSAAFLPFSEVKHGSHQ